MNNEKTLVNVIAGMQAKIAHKKTHIYVHTYKKLVLALFVHVIQKCNTLNVFVLEISDDGEIVNFISQNSP